MMASKSENTSLMYFAFSAFVFVALEMLLGFQFAKKQVSNTRVSFFVPSFCFSGLAKHGGVCQSLVRWVYSLPFKV